MTSPPVPGRTADTAADALAEKLASYAQESMEFGPGQRSEDLLLQRVWNLAGDVRTLLAALSSLQARLADAVKAGMDHEQRIRADLAAAEARLADAERRLETRLEADSVFRVYDDMARRAYFAEARVVELERERDEAQDALTAGDGLAVERDRSVVTHGRHCLCSSCAKEDWTNPELAPCGMHGPDCPNVYAPYAEEGA